MTVATVRMVLTAGRSIQDGLVVSPVPFNTFFDAGDWHDDVEF